MEKPEIRLSNCCFENVIEESDVCSKCKEHCKVILDEDYIEEYYETKFADKFGRE